MKIIPTKRMVRHFLRRHHLTIAVTLLTLTLAAFVLLVTQALIGSNSNDSSSLAASGNTTNASSTVNGANKTTNSQTGQAAAKAGQQSSVYAKSSDVQAAPQLKSVQRSNPFSEDTPR